jgi:hypothetical protein
LAKIIFEQKEKAGGLRTETRPPGQEEGSGRDRPTRGYGIRLAWLCIRAKGMPNAYLVSLFNFLADFKKGFVLKKHIILNSYKWKTIR